MHVTFRYRITSSVVTQEGSYKLRHRRTEHRLLAATDPVGKGARGIRLHLSTRLKIRSARELQELLRMQDLAAPNVEGVEHHVARTASSLLMLLVNNTYSWTSYTPTPFVYDAPYSP
jgi:hypothetical protein